MKLGRRAGFAVLMVMLGYVLVMASAGLVMLTRGQMIPAPLVFAVRWFGAWGMLSPAVVFWLFVAPQFLGSPRILSPVRYGLVLAVLGWIVYWGVNWQYGVFKFGELMMFRLVAANLASMGVLYGAALAWKKAPTVPKAVLYGWLFALWLFTIAFLRLG